MPELAPVIKYVLPDKSGILSGDQALPGETAFSNTLATLETPCLTDPSMSHN